MCFRVSSCRLEDGRRTNGTDPLSPFALCFFILLAIALFLPLLMRMLWTVDWATIVAVSSLHACMCRLSLPLIPNGDVE